MKNSIHVTEKELAAELMKIQTVKGMPMFASIIQLTDTGAKKTGNPYSQINKLSKVSIILNTDYVKAVTNQLAREHKEATEYMPGKDTNPLTFGENNRFIGVNNKGGFVLQYRPNDKIKPQSIYFADGKRVDKAQIAQYLPTIRKATNQGTEKEVRWRKVNLSNVLRLTVNGTTYNVIR
jgi:hypothetical protein